MVSQLPPCARSAIFFGIGPISTGHRLGDQHWLGGLRFGLMYLRRRSAIEAIATHAFGDVLADVAATWLAR